MKKKYKVIRTCFFKRKVWNEGDVVDLDGIPEKEIPHHFKLISEKEAEKETRKPKEEDSPKSLSQLQKETQGKTNKSGFAKGLETPAQFKDEKK